MPKHFQQGYAVVDITYISHFTKITDERYTPTRHQPSVRATKTSRDFDINRRTYYAECTKNETGDKQLSRWYSNAVKPEVERWIKEDVEKINDNIARRIEKFEEDSDKGLINKGQARPPEYKYDDFDARMLEGDKPYPSEKEPAGKRCHKILWR